MKIVRGLVNLRPDRLGCIATIGNFDGIHRGHQALLAEVTTKARANGLPAVVVTFEPQPLELFVPAQKVPRLMRLREKYHALAEQQVDKLVVLHFNQALASLRADEFVKKIVYQGLAAKHIIVGDDFHFGFRREGDFDFLQQAGLQYGFTVSRMEALLFRDQRVSSTRVRQALAASDLAEATRLLGRPYTMIGRVVHGDKLDRQLGFPTANIHLHRAVSPIHGVYIVRMHGIGDQPLPGVANVGTRPTIGGTRSLLEVFLFDFNQEIYGHSVTIEFLEKIRDEERYDNLDLLRQAIASDVLIGRDYFKRDHT